MSWSRTPPWSWSSSRSWWPSSPASTTCSPRACWLSSVDRDGCGAGPPAHSSQRFMQRCPAVRKFSCVRVLRSHRRRRRSRARPVRAGRGRRGADDRAGAGHRGRRRRRCGDEALLPAPYWTTYPEAIRLAGGVPVEVPTDETTGYLATVDQLEAARTDRTKLLLFCSPSNPTGAVYPREHVEAIGRWAVEHRGWVVTDEIYEHLVYDGHSAPSLPVVVPEMADRCVVVNGVAKTYAMTGWRVGWMIGPRDVIDAAGNLQSHLTSNVANVSQAAALAAVTGDLSAATQMRAAFDRRRRTMTRMLADIPGVTCPEPFGAFYCYPSLRAVLGQLDGG